MDGVVYAVADTQGATEGSPSIHDYASETTSQSYVTVEDERRSGGDKNDTPEEIVVHDGSSDETSQEARLFDAFAPKQRTKFEVVLRSLPPTVRHQYEEVRSDVVETVLARTTFSDGERFSVQFTDGKYRSSVRYHSYKPN